MNHFGIFDGTSIELQICRVKEFSIPLCQFCEAQPALPGDIYCCAGCRVLDQNHTDESDTRIATPTEKSEEDVMIYSSFAKKIGNNIEFKCRVDPLACEACLQSLAAINDRFPALINLKWDRERSLLSLIFTKDNYFPSLIFNHLKDLSLNPQWVKINEDTEKSYNSQQKKLLRLGLTGAFAGNIMLFAVPVYGGLSGEWLRIFEWIQFAFFLPVFFWSAVPFYRTAFVSLKLKTLNVDIPLTFAFIVGSIFSFYQIFTGGHALYFDSLSGFFFLILSSRYLLESSIEKYLIRPQFSDFFEKSFFNILRIDTGSHANSSEIPILASWQDIQINDIIIAKRNERLPVDGILIDRGAEFETAWMNGESHPVLRLRGSEISAGSRLVSNQAKIQVTKTAKDTEFAKLIEQLEPSSEKLRVTTEAKIGTGLVIFCFLSAALLFIFAPQLGATELLKRSIAIFIVACPCAISFAAPLSRARANHLARKIGFWVRDPEIWSRLQNIKKIAFDKTGTLTSGQLKLAHHSPLIDDHWKKIILSLENISQHPIAESLRKTWGEMSLFEVKNAQEILGLGVQGEISGNNYRIQKSTAIDSTHISLELYQNDEKVLELSLTEEARHSLTSALEFFKKNFELFIISGDRQKKVQQFAQQHNFIAQNVFGDLNPQKKLETLKKIEPDLYFGDGTNDLLALKYAPVSVAALGACREAQSSSDILMLKADIDLVPELIELSFEIKKINRRNFILALTYNLASAIAAIMGLVHPLVAALLMPIASLTLLGSTFMATSKVREIEKRITT